MNDPYQDICPHGIEREDCTSCTQIKVMAEYTIYFCILVGFVFGFAIGWLY